MGIFSGRDDAQKGTAIDNLVNQKVVAPRVFLSAAEGEEHIRVYGQTKYAATRSRLLNEALAEGQPFWQSKVQIEPGFSDEVGSVPKKLLLILADGVIIGELSEFDRRAQEFLSFDKSYVGRAVIQDDLIGALVQLYIDPSNQVL